MREIIYPKSSSAPIVLALGFFDCLHIGHIAVLDACKQSAIPHQADVAVATFLNNPNGKDKQIYTYTERQIKLKEQQVDIVLGINFDKKFSEISPDDFLDTLFGNYNIKAVVCGFDYRYGANRVGDSVTLKAKWNALSIPVVVVNEVSADSKKVSSTLIKSLLSEGAIESANTLLSSNYTLCGLVARGRGQGKQFGVPTANIILSEDKHTIKAGVYGTHAYVNGKKYKAVTNVGTAPTFGENSPVIETHIIDFDGDIYGKTMTVEFVKRIRNIKKFESVTELKEQIQKDCKR